MDSKLRVKSSFKEGLKKYILLIVAALLIVAVTLTVVFTTKKPKTVTPDTGLNTNVDKDKDKDTEKDPDSKPTGSETEMVAFTLPVLNATIMKGYSATALQKNETLNQWEIHKGLDFKAESGAEVLAVFGGTVSNVYNDYMLGTVIKIDHGNGLTTLYASLAENVNVKAGDKVTKGQVIGYVANTSKKESLQGDHLHFEVIEESKLIDPEKYMTLENK